jgi:hypothetical protein
LDKDEPTGSSEVDEAKIMDNILQQSGNVQVDDNDDVNIEYISTTSAAQAICNLQLSRNVPIDSASGIYLQKVTFWKI